ncbi:hypothetical protein [Hymenobacter baengnokdamensis]|uniref:hypothetical protein n=1 Tax=Hymenobacter baengnokdamensis TaxID=2615203 RepID=UPI0012446C83|nr:hypothetical protein [Hymenobacter baengnokdamensis]
MLIVSTSFISSIFLHDPCFYLEQKQFLLSLQSIRNDKHFLAIATMENATGLSALLAPGDIGAIAKELNLSHGAASSAIRRGLPGHPAVRLALARAEASGALAAAQQLAKLFPTAQVA